MIERLRSNTKAIVADGYKRVRVEIRLKSQPGSGRVLGPLEIHEHDVAYEATVDVWDLEQLVDRAFRNKSRRTKYGPITVKIVSSREISVTLEPDL